MPDSTNRINELESRLAYLENSQEELSAVVADQGKIIDRLLEQVQRQKHQLLELADDMPRKPADDLPPPHY